jgi:BirA family biotin operon repressor/biotin-[acetyl-CoA-carboxylase] ligase
VTATETKIHWIELDTIDSTNNHAMELIRDKKAKNGMAVFSTKQTKGKGQRGKEWKDEGGESLSCSFIIEPEIYGLTHHFHLIALTASAIRKVVEATIRIPVHIKWPNDIYVGDQKAGGILIESVTRGKDWRYAVIGFGINVNQKHFDEKLPNPVSLRQLTGKNYDIKRLAEDCLNIILKDLTRRSFTEMLSQYSKYLYKLNQTISLSTHSGIITDLMKGVTEEGMLLIGEQTLRVFEPGEVQWILQPPPFSAS